MSTPYAVLVCTLRAGAVVPSQIVTAILESTGHTQVDLDNAIGSAAPRRPGDACECGGTVAVTNSRHRGQWQTQYMRCPQCGTRYGKRIVPAAMIRRRTRNA